MKKLFQYFIPFLIGISSLLCFLYYLASLYWNTKIAPTICIIGADIDHSPTYATSTLPLWLSLAGLAFAILWRSITRHK